MMSHGKVLFIRASIEKHNTKCVHPIVDCVDETSRDMFLFFLFSRWKQLSG